MEPEAKKKVWWVVLLVAAALALPVALLVFGVRGMWQERQERQAAQVEFNEALRLSLERAAETVLPAPTLGENAIVVECPGEDFESEVQRVVRLAKGLGGSSSSWNDGETVRIVASVPESAADLFRESVGRGVYDLVAANETKTMTMVEVLIRPVAPPKTVPKKK
jgi:hypothetical protein